MTWNREQYLAEVLEPARKAGNVPPPDLYARYGLPAGLSDQAAFTRQVTDVVAFWRELKGRRMYARLADTLITAHAELEKAGRLTLRSFAERHADSRREQLNRLARLAEVEAGAATHVGPDTLARLRSALDGAVTDAEVVRALEKAGVRVVGKFPALQAAPHPKQADLARHLMQLGVWPSAAVVFHEMTGKGFRVLGGFRLSDGRTLDDEAIASARSRVDALPYTDPAKTPSENVLAILRTAARKPGDRRLLVGGGERLRPRPAAASSSGLSPPRPASPVWTRRMLASSPGAGQRDTGSDAPAGGLSWPGRLRNAQRLAAGLPVDRLRERIAALRPRYRPPLGRPGNWLRPGRAYCRPAGRAVSKARDAPNWRGGWRPCQPPRRARPRPDGGITC